MALGNTNGFRNQLARILAILGIIGVLICGFQANSSLHLAFAAAAWGSAAVLGFLFGFPSVQAGTAGDPHTSQENVLNANNNLRQIADWLTKTIVGVSLVEATHLWHSFHGLCTHSVPEGDPVTVGILLGGTVYFACHGFLTSYIATRIWLAPEMVEADRRTQGTIMEKDAVVAKALPAEADLLHAPPATPGKPDAKSAQIIKSYVGKTLEEIASTAEIPLWAKCQLLAGDNAKAIEGYSRAVALGLDNPRILYEYAVAVFRANDRATTGASFRKVLDLLAFAVVKRPLIEDQELLHSLFQTYTYLLLFDPTGYEQILKLQPELDQAYGSQPDRLQDLLLNLSCAFGQWHKALTTANPPRDPVVVTQAREGALHYAQRLVQADRGWKARLAALLRPAPGSNEDDLSSLGDDPDFGPFIAP